MAEIGEEKMALSDMYLCVTFTSGNIRRFAISWNLMLEGCATHFVGYYCNNSKCVIAVVVIELLYVYQYKLLFWFFEEFTILTQTIERINFGSQWL